MTALLVVLASVVGYSGIGALIAIRSLPYAWQHAQLCWKNHYEYQRVNVATWTTFRMLFWPVLLPALFMGMAITRYDPARMKQEVEARDRKIRDLERELGLR